MKHVSRRASTEERIGAGVKHLLEQYAVEYQQILDDLFRQPKSGVAYGEQREVSFAAHAGAERGVTFFVVKDGGRRRFGSKASFTANNGKKASKRTVKFIINRGKKYGEKGKYRAKGNRASAPGEAPAIQTAALRKSVRRVITRISRLNYSVLIGVSLQGGRGGPAGKSGRSIAEDLEFGTSRMQARPAWRPALAILMQRVRSGRRQDDYASWWESSTRETEYDSAGGS